MRFQIPFIIRFFLKDLLWRVKTEEKAIYLTFDDGPHPVITPEVLEILDKFNAKATFFCVGQNTERFPETFNQIIERGHSVGNHTYNHIKGFEFSVEEYVENVRKASKLIDSRLFRPPHGQIKLGQIKALKKDYKIVMWDYVTYDFQRDLTPEEIFSTLMRRTRKGSVVVFHDSEKAAKNMLAVLPEALKFWRKEGYEINKIL